MNPIPFTPEQLKDVDRVALAEHLIASGRYLRFILGYLPEWRPFFHEYAADLPELERKLCGELDAESQFVVHRAIKQYELLLAAEDAAGRRLDRYDILVAGDFFLSDKERIIRQAVAIGAPLPWESPEENGAAYLDKLVFPLEKRHLLTYDCMRLGFGLEYVPQHCRDIKGKDVIDGGGFVGDSALTYCRYHPRKIYSFEPNPPTFKTLEGVVRLNGREKDIVLVPLALWGGGAEWVVSALSTVRTTVPVFARKNKNRQLTSKRYRLMSLSSKTTFIPALLASMSKVSNMPLFRDRFKRSGSSSRFCLFRSTIVRSIFSRSNPFLKV